MSLQHTANNLAAHGRGPDTILVHMTPGELKSLNDLAMAHGGHITINPDTGLPEAGFLSSILPMIAGAALGPAGMGLFESAGMAGLGVGALTGLATGSLSKGLMAGMGAYGGAGLGEALAKSGMEASTAVEAQKQALAESNKALADAAQRNTLFQDSTALKPELTSQGADLMAKQQAANQGLSNVVENARQSYADSGIMGKFGTMGEGLKTGFGNIASNAGGNMGLAKYGLAAAAPAIGEMMQPKKQEPMKMDSNPGQQYNYTPGTLQGPYTADPSGRERQYFNHQYTPRYADGGTVEPGTPTKYSYDPMAQMFNKIESTPSDDQNKQKVETQAQIEHSSGGKNANSYSPPGDPSGFHTPGELASNRAMFLPTVLNLLTPFPIKLAMDALGVSPFGSTSSGGVSKSSGSPMAGVSFKGDVGQMANTLTTQALAAQAASSGFNGNAGAAGAAAAAAGAGNGSGASSAGGSSPGSAYSDARLKDNIVPIGQAVDKVKKLDGVTYDMDGQRKAGLVAQQVEKVLPEAVHKDSKGMRMVDYNDVSGLLVQAIKELDAKKKAGGGMAYAAGGATGEFNLGGYSDGGRLLRGPGDGVSDSIPATIGHKQPARLADGEFVVPARIVSELGNGSTEAGARKLYAMMDRVQSARSKTVGKGRIAKNSRADKYLPA